MSWYRNIYAVTGSIGTGKSTTCQFLSEFGAFVVSADDLARRVVMPGSPGYQQLVASFGSSYLLPDGAIDRKKLGSLVFSNPTARHQLEAITHPLIRDACRKDFQAAPPDATIPRVYDVPLLFESGLEKEGFKGIVVVSSTRENVRKRLRQRGLTGLEAEERITSQLPIEDKTARADYVIENNETLDDLRNKVAELYRWMQR